MQSSTTPLNLQNLQVLGIRQRNSPCAFGHNAVIYKNLSSPLMGLSIALKRRQLLISKGKEGLKGSKQNVGGRGCRVQLSEFAPAAAAVYGTLLLGGGLFAYTRSRSKGSLLGGVTGGILLGTAYFLMQGPETKSLADALGFGTAFLFAAVFGIRFVSTHKLVPTGLLLGLSVGALVVFISAYFQDKI